MQTSHERQGEPHSGTLAHPKATDAKKHRPEITGKFGPPYYPITQTPLGTLFASIERFLAKVESEHKITTPIPAHLSHAQITLWRIVLGLKDIYGLLKATVERFDKGADPGITGFVGIGYDLQTFVEGLIKGDPKPSSRAMNIPPPALALTILLEFELENLKKELEEKAKSKSFVADAKTILPLALAKLKNVKNKIDTTYFPQPLLDKLCAEIEVKMREFVTDYCVLQPITVDQALQRLRASYSWRGALKPHYSISDALDSAFTQLSKELAPSEPTNGENKPNKKKQTLPAANFEQLRSKVKKILQDTKSKLIAAANQPHAWGPKEAEINEHYDQLETHFFALLNKMADEKFIVTPTSELTAKLKSHLESDKLDFIKTIPLDITLLYNTWEFTLNAVMQLQQDCKDPFSLLKFFNPDALAHSLLGLVSIKVTNAERGEYTVDHIGKEKSPADQNGDAALASNEDTALALHEDAVLAPRNGKAPKPPKDPNAFSLSKILGKHLNPALINAINGLFKVGEEIVEQTGLLAYINQEKKWLQDLETTLATIPLTLPELTGDPKHDRATLQAMCDAIPQQRTMLQAQQAEAAKRQKTYETITVGYLVNLLKTELVKEEEKEKKQKEEQHAQVAADAPTASTLVQSTESNGWHDETNGIDSLPASRSSHEFNAKILDELALSGLDLLLPDWMPEKIKPVETVHEKALAPAPDGNNLDHDFSSPARRKKEEPKIEYQKKPLRSALIEQARNLVTACQKKETALTLFEQQLSQQLEQIDDLACLQIFDEQNFKPLREQCQAGLAAITEMDAALTTDCSNCTIDELERLKQELTTLKELALKLQQNNISVLPALANKPETVKAQFKFQNGLATVKLQQTTDAIDAQSRELAQKCQRFFERATTRSQQLERLQTQIRDQEILSKLLQDVDLPAMPAKLAQLQENSKTNQNALHDKDSQYQSLSSELTAHASTVAQTEAQLSATTLAIQTMSAVIATTTAAITTDNTRLNQAKQNLNGVPASAGTRAVKGNLARFNDIAETLDPALDRFDIPLALAQASRTVADNIQLLNTIKPKLDGTATIEMYRKLSEEELLALLAILFGVDTPAYNDELAFVTKCRGTFTIPTFQSTRTDHQILWQQKIAAMLNDAGPLQQRQRTLQNLTTLHTEIVTHRATIAALDGAEGVIARNTQLLDTKHKELAAMQVQESALTETLNQLRSEIERLDQQASELKNQQVHIQAQQSTIETEIQKLTPQVTLYNMITAFATQAGQWNEELDAKILNPHAPAITIDSNALQLISSTFATLQPELPTLVVQPFTALIAAQTKTLNNLQAKTKAMAALHALSAAITKADTDLFSLTTLVQTLSVRESDTVTRSLTTTTLAYQALDTQAGELNTMISALDKNASLTQGLQELTTQLSTQQTRLAQLTAEAEYRRTYATHQAKWQALIEEIKDAARSIQLQTDLLQYRRIFNQDDIAPCEKTISALQDQITALQRKIAQLDMEKKTVLSIKPQVLSAALEPLQDTACSDALNNADTAINGMRTHLARLKKHNEERNKFVKTQKEQLTIYLTDRATRFAKKDRIFSCDKTRREAYVTELQTALDNYNINDNIGTLILRIDAGIAQFPGQVFVQNYLLPMRRTALNRDNQLVIGAEQKFATEPAPPAIHVLLNWMLRHKSEIAMAILLTTAAVLMFTLPVLGQLIGTSIVLFKAAALLQLLIPSLSAATSLMISQIAVPILVGLTVFAASLALGCLVRMGLNAACSAAMPPADMNATDYSAQSSDASLSAMEMGTLEPLPPSLAIVPG